MMIKRKGKTMIRYMRMLTPREWLDVALSAAVLAVAVGVILTGFGIAELVWPAR